MTPVLYATARPRSVDTATTPSPFPARLVGAALTSSSTPAREATQVVMPRRESRTHTRTSALSASSVLSAFTTPSARGRITHHPRRDG